MEANNIMYIPQTGRRHWRSSYLLAERYRVDKSHVLDSKLQYLTSQEQMQTNQDIHEQVRDIDTRVDCQLFFAYSIPTATDERAAPSLPDIMAMV